ncbi:MAG: hypothetical protein H6Q05_4437 [Acidobacteria bacterium]|jgi:hypothetical protein|nr:hypothetical protein [Acidobacteriota bacterium]
MRKHIHLLGILNIIWGSFGFIAALMIMLIFGGAVGIIGMASRQEPDAAIAIPIVTFVGSIIFFVLLITSLPAVVTGIGLLRMASWSRIVAIILSALHLVSFPFGTALGAYGLWVLLSRETVSCFEQPQKPVKI